MATYFDYLRDKYRRGPAAIGTPVDTNREFDRIQAEQAARNEPKPLNALQRFGGTELGARPSSYNPNRYSGAGTLLSSIARRNLANASQADQTFNVAANPQAARSLDAERTASIYGAPARSAIADAIRGNNALGGVTSDAANASPYDAEQNKIQTVASAARAAGRLPLGSPDVQNRTVISNGKETVYFPGGGSASSNLPEGTKVNTTPEGHSIVSYPNGLQKFVGAGGESYHFTPTDATSVAKEFNNPATGLSPTEATNYLNASRSPSLGALMPGAESRAFNAPPSAPLVTDNTAPSNPLAYRVGQQIGGAGRQAVSLGNEVTNALNNFGTRVASAPLDVARAGYNVGAGIVGAAPILSDEEKKKREQY